MSPKSNKKKNMIRSTRSLPDGSPLHSIELMTQIDPDRSRGYLSPHKTFQNCPLQMEIPHASAASRIPQPLYRQHTGSSRRPRWHKRRVADAKARGGSHKEICMAPPPSPPALWLRLTCLPIWARIRVRNDKPLAHRSNETRASPPAKSASLAGCPCE